MIGNIYTCRHAHWVIDTTNGFVSRYIILCERNGIHVVELSSVLSQFLCVPSVDIPFTAQTGLVLCTVLHEGTASFVVLSVFSKHASCESVTGTTVSVHSSESLSLPMPVVNNLTHTFLLFFYITVFWRCCLTYLLLYSSSYVWRHTKWLINCIRTRMDFMRVWMWMCVLVSEQDSHCLHR